nr:MAG TPA: minor structural protein [Caudoviricetes sp.]
MNTQDKVINNLAIQLANKTIIEAFSTTERDEVKEQLQEANSQLEKINKVLQSNEELKALFDKVAEELDKSQEEE